jgi:hypothetical protein
MKKFALLFLFLGTLSVHAQITLEQTYTQPTNVSIQRLLRIDLPNAGIKYYSVNRTTYEITVYNSDHTFYKSFNVPLTTQTLWSITYLSETIFNTDSTDLEYVASYQNSQGTFVIDIYDEFGNQLLHEPDFTLGNVDIATHDQAVYNDDSSAMLMLYGNSQIHVAKVFRLPGKVPDQCCHTGGSNGTSLNVSNYQIGAGSFYPNPASLTFTYELPSNIHSGQLIFYSMNGAKIKEVLITQQTTIIDLSSSEFANGTYIFQLITDKGISMAEKVVVHR